MMKGKICFLMVIAVLCLPGRLSAETSALSTPIRQLTEAADFKASVKYAVSLPMADDDIVYTVDLVSQQAPGDSLLNCDYLVDWELKTTSGDLSEGFSAYFDGHAYRYRDHKLTEYHFEWDSIPFRGIDGGVQRNGQFVELFPFSLARQLEAMQTDSTFTVAVTPGSLNGRDATVIKATQRIHGLDSRIISLSLDAANGLPLRLSVLCNPGMLGEQETIATYDYSTSAALRAATSEEELLDRYPEVFDKYRVSNYSVENLRDHPMPAFALPTLTRERYAREKGASFAAPTIVAVLDPTVASTAETIGTLRSVADRLPFQCDIIMAFVSNDTDAIEALTGPLRIGETHLSSARSLARDCGITAYPVFLLCDRSGRVADVILGTSSALPSTLLQSLSLLSNP